MPLSLSDVVEIIGRQFWRMVLIGGLCAGAAGWALLSASPTFEARTLLLYKLGREYLYVPSAGTVTPGVRAPDPGDMMQIIGAEMQIVANRHLKRRFLEEFGVQRIFPDATSDPEAMEAAIDALRGLVTVSLIPNTLMVQILVRHEDPAVAAEMANKLVDLYLESRGAVFSQRDTDFLRTRLKMAREGEDRFAAEIRALLGGVDPLVFDTDRDIRISRRTALEKEIAEVETRIVSVTNRMEELEGAVATLTPTIVEYRNVERNPVVLEAEARIVALEAEHVAAAASLGAAHPTVLALSRQIEGARQIVQNEPAETESGGRIAANPVRMRAEMDLAEARIERRELEARHAHLVSERDANALALAQAASVSSELARLQRMADLQREEAAQYDARLRDSIAEETQGASSLGSVRILERATPPSTPVGAPKSVRLIIAVLFGGIVGLLVGALSYFSRPTILTPDMLERRLRAPVLAEIGWRRTGRSALGQGN